MDFNSLVKSIRLSGYSGRVIVCIISILTYLHGFTQENQWMIGGAIGFDRAVNTTVSSSFDTDSKDTRLVLQPYLGKQINHYWLGGISMGFTFGHSKRGLVEDNQTETVDHHSESIGLFFRRAFNPGNKLIFHLESNLGATRGNTRIEYAQHEIHNANTLSMAITLDPVLTYSLNRKLNLLGRMQGLGYQRGIWKLKGQADRDFSEFNASLDLLNIRIGVELIL